MTELQKKNIRDYFDKMIARKKEDCKPLPEDVPVKITPSFSIVIDRGIELVAEAYGKEIEIYKDLNCESKWFVVDGIFFRQWISLGDWKNE